LFGVSVELVLSQEHGGDEELLDAVDLEVLGFFLEVLQRYLHLNAVGLFDALLIFLIDRSFLSDFV